ncbi:MAG TPA: DUF255 domain-containing protein [Patescibacteria group bacterium]|nr:DUF255 domain-containing protein [Patescibacteria group bacterium]
MPGLKHALLIMALPALLAAQPVQAAVGSPGSSTTSIAWREFDAKSFQQAKEQSKLVLLSIQAPWGHWDRLMSDLTFADPRVVALVNTSFVPIKVDPLMRPDIWARYGMGGWPTTTLLLHTGQPMYFPDAARKTIKAGGTYYATEPMLSYLQDLATYYSANKENVEKAADEIAKGMLAHKDVGSAPLTPDILEVTVSKILEAHGAWNPNPEVKSYRTPDVDSAELAYAYWIKKGNRNVLDTELHRLADMARGGIHDQIGGGFHRLAADAAWRVPAFEKLLGVNAEALQTYADAYMVTGSSRYRDIAEDTARYVLGTLRDPAGWFYAYQAADSKLGEDGDYYTWRLDEVKTLLTEEEQKIIIPAFDIGDWGEMVNSAPRNNVLFLSEGPQLLAERLKMDRAKVTELFESGRRKLLEARSKRPAPAVGRILVSDVNAEMAASLIMSGDLLKRPELTRSGIEALDFLWGKVYDPKSGLVDHAWSPDSGRAGLAEFFTDQVQTVRALLAAYESTGDSRYFEKAGGLAAAADKSFADALNGGWMDRLYDADAPGFVSWPTRSIRDNSLFAESLVRIRYLSGRAEDDKLVKSARKGLESWADEFGSYKEMSAPFGLASDRVQNPPLEVIVVGDTTVGEGKDLDALARSLYQPWKVLRHLNAKTGAQELQARQMTAPANPAIFFCEASRCAGPFARQDKLREKLDQFLGIKHAAAPAQDKAKEEAP